MAVSEPWQTPLLKPVQATHGMTGHNDIMGYAPVVLAVMRCFDLEGTVYPSNELD